MNIVYIVSFLISTASESRLKAKIRRIENALDADPVDVAALSHLARIRDGLVNNYIRTKVWPKLLLVNVYDMSKTSASTKKRKPRCK